MMKNTEESIYWPLMEHENSVSREATDHFLPQIHVARWSRMVRILSIAAFCFGLALGICVISLVYLQGSTLLMLSGAFYYFFGGIGVLAVAWQFRDGGAEDHGEDLGPTREQMATTVIAGTFVMGGITIILCSVFHVQMQIHTEERDSVWLPLAVCFGGFLVIAALQHRASVELYSKSIKVAAVYSALMSTLSLGLLLSHLILAYDIMEKKTWLFLDPVIADVVAFLSIAFGVKVALFDISGNHCCG